MYRTPEHEKIIGITLNICHIYLTQNKDIYDN